MKGLRDIVITSAYDIYRSSLNFKQILPDEKYKIDGNGSVTINPDNILDGRLGFLFFMLELHRVTNGPEIWNSILEELEWFEEYAGNHPTNNYTVFCGRLGIGFYYLKLFEYTGQTDFFDKAIDMAREYYESNSFKYDIISNKSLLDGISGILLFIHQLYLQKRETWLLDCIEKFVLKLVYTSHPANPGIFWGAFANRDGRNYGFATGAAGIAFVLHQLGKSFNNGFIKELALLALSYEQEFWSKVKGSCSHGLLLKDYSLGYGITGIELVKLHMNRTGEKPGKNMPGLPTAKEIFLCNKNEDKAEYGVCSGISGIGLAFIQMYKASGDKTYLAEAIDIAQRVIVKCKEETGAIPFSMQGFWGIGYFLLKLIEPENDKSGLFFMPDNHQHVDLGELPLHSVFKPANPEIYEIFLNRIFKGTLSVLKTEFPGELAIFLHQKHSADFGDFITFVEENALVQKGNEKINLLLFEFERDKFVLSFITSLNAPVSGSRQTILDIDALMRLSFDDFRVLKFVHSDSIWIYSKEKVVQEDEIFTKESFMNFFQNYGSNTIFYRLSDSGWMQSGSMGIKKIIFDKFRISTSVFEACEQVFNFLSKQGNEVLSLLKENYGITDNNHLQAVIREIILDGVRLCIMEGFLEASE